jgi:hypothetical protein
MGRKSHHVMERVYAHLSKNGCRKSGLLADPELNVILLKTVKEKSKMNLNKHLPSNTERKIQFKNSLKLQLQINIVNNNI